MDIDCEQCRLAISADLDGEDPGMSIETALAHADVCTECAAFREFAHAIRRYAMVDAPRIPDLAPHLVKTRRIESPMLRWTVARAVLAVCAAEVIAFSVLDLVGPSHESRHLGSFSVAFGVVLLSVVARPARARMMVPVASVLALGLAIGAAMDLASGSIPLLTEARHVPELVSVITLLILARPARERPRTTRHPMSWTPVATDRKQESA